MVSKPTAMRIASAARSLLDAEGVDAVTMRRVAAGVGVTAMALYRHYADRDALLNALADDGFTELMKRLSQVRLTGDLFTRLHGVLDANLDFALQEPRLFELMFLQPRRGARQFPHDFAAGKSPTANEFAALMSEGIRDGTFQAVDVYEVAFESGALLQGLVMLYLGERMAVTPAEFRRICHRALERYMNGLRE